MRVHYLGRAGEGQLSGLRPDHVQEVGPGGQEALLHQRSMLQLYPGGEAGRLEKALRRGGRCRARRDGRDGGEAQKVRRQEDSDEKNRRESRGGEKDNRKEDRREKTNGGQENGGQEDVKSPPFAKGGGMFEGGRSPGGTKEEAWNKSS